jgi:hypothetical protein
VESLQVSVSIEQVLRKDSLPSSLSDVWSLRNLSIDLRISIRELFWTLPFREELAVPGRDFDRDSCIDEVFIAPDEGRLTNPPLPRIVNSWIDREIVSSSFLFGRRDFCSAFFNDNSGRDSRFDL